MTRSLISGTTDYSHQSISDIISDIDSYIDEITSISMSFDEKIKKIKDKSYWNKIHHDFNSVIYLSQRLFATALEELKEIRKDLLLEVRDDHVIRIRNLGGKSRELFLRYGEVWNGKYQNKEYGNESFALVEWLYKNGKDTLGGMMDLINISNRLNDFVGRKGKNKPESIGSVENVKGNKEVIYGDKSQISSKIKKEGNSDLLQVIGIIVAIIGIAITIILSLPQKNTFLKEENESLPGLQYWNVGLKSINPSDNGKEISQLPDGVYFYASPSLIISEVKSPKYDYLTTRDVRQGSDFELQKIENRYYIIGFFSDENYAKVDSINSFNSLNAKLFPVRWGGAKNAVAIPFDSVYSINEGEFIFDENNKAIILNIGSREVRNNTEYH